MKTVIKILLLSLLIPFSVNAFGEALTQSNPSCLCEQSGSDQLEEPQSFNFGKFQGLCIDSCRFRPARLLGQKSGADKTEIFQLGNILHFGRFYKGSIPLKDIESVQVGFEEFLPGVYHVFLQFEILPKAPAVRLTDQLDPKKTVEVRSFVISAEGVPPKDHKYDLVESYFGHYLVAIRLVTGAEMIRWTSELKHPVKMVPLKIESSSVAEIFKKAVQSSDKLRLQNVYQLFTNNCSTTILNLIDSELGWQEVSSAWRKIEEALPIAGPIGTFRALKLRDLIQPEAKML